MAKINILPKNVAELIAAGEVVERPSSAVKEMIENSIDAGACAVTVEIKNGGVKYIRITDNGCGINREDVRTAFISHATSKIRSGEDLDAIFTLGFRGEALPSIAAVSRLSMMTKTEDEETGTAIEIHGGEEVSFDDTGCPTGTTVIVRDLFFNTPARMKFLKKDMTEGTYVSDAVSKIAISHPEIRFTLIKDGKRTLSTPGNGSLIDAIFSVFGKEIADSLIPVDYEYNSFRIKGFISRPLNNRPSRNMQYFYVNGRYVRIPVAAAALDEAYKNSIMVGKFPVCFLFVDLPAGKIDVNVHPAKTEIRFSEDTKVFEAIFYAAKSALNKGDTVRPEVTLRDKKDITAKKAPDAVQMTFSDSRKETKETEDDDFCTRAFSAAANKPSDSEASLKHDEKNIKEENSASEKIIPPNTAFNPEKKNTPSVNIFPDENDACDKKLFSEVKTCADSDPLFSVCRTPVEIFRDTSSVFNHISSKEDVEEKNNDFINCGIPASDISVDSQKLSREDPPEIKNDFTVIGEIFRTYILVELDERMLIIDKHAAHERMIFNKLSQTDFTKDTQMLLAPVSVTLSAKEYAAVIENIDVFAKGGFIVDDFGDGSVVVRGFPLVLSKEDIPSIIAEMAAELLKGKIKPVPEKLQWLYHSASCRAAIKAGDALKKEETEAFVKELLKDESIRYCPHGRPVMYELSKREIEKQFGRV